MHFENIFKLFPSKHRNVNGYYLQVSVLNDATVYIYVCVCVRTYLGMKEILVSFA